MVMVEVICEEIDLRAGGYALFLDRPGLFHQGFLFLYIYALLPSYLPTCGELPSLSSIHDKIRSVRLAQVTLSSTWLSFL